MQSSDVNWISALVGKLLIEGEVFFLCRVEKSYYPLMCMVLSEACDLLACGCGGGLRLLLRG